MSVVRAVPTASPRAIRIVASFWVVLVSCSAPARAEPPEDKHRMKRLVLIGSGLAIYFVGELVVKDEITPDACRWCGGNSFDDGIRDALLWANTDRAKNISNLTGYALAPLGAAGMLLLASRDVAVDRWAVYVDDLIPVLEAVVYSQLLTNVAKYTIGRQRPFVRFSTDPGREHDADDNLSFFSGHASLGFAIAVASGAVAHRRGYRLEPAIWASLLALAGTTSYLRIAADRHYASDVLVGTAIGIGAGIGIPRLTGSLPERTTIVPTGAGLALVGTF